tara:strand:+ start:9313 stop:9813 length:501 start_codon:yes stop_codon:yes gene_type:complete
LSEEVALRRVELTRLECAEIVDALLERHDAYLGDDESFVIEGFTSESEAHVKMLLSNKDESFYYPVECRLHLGDNEIREPGDALMLVLDFLDYYISRFLREDRELFLPIEWGSFEFDKYEVWARGQILNRKLDQIADRLMRGDISEEEAQRLLRSEAKDHPRKGDG